MGALHRAPYRALAIAGSIAFSTMSCDGGERSQLSAADGGTDAARAHADSDAPPTIETTAAADRADAAALADSDAAAAADGGDDAGSSAANAPVIGVSFVPVETQTRAEAAQTVAHMELTGLLFLPGEHGALVWEKAGRVAHYRLAGAAFELQGEFELVGIESGNDCGLISIALDPDWEQNRLLYASHCISRTHGAVTRYRFDGRDYASVSNTHARVIELGDPNATKAWHNVGAIGFFPDAERSMWILVGEKNNRANAQDPKTNLGAILRIVPSRAADGGYAPHPDNPFGGPGADPAHESSPDLYGWGLRSPWRGAIDARGRIWIGDVGEVFEEINLARAPGSNFGWGRSDGPCDPAAADGGCEGLVDPIASWDRSSNHRYRVEDAVAQPTSNRVAWVGTPYAQRGADPYRGFLNGTTLFSDMCMGFVRALAVDEGGRVVRDEAVGHLVGLSGAAQAPDGHIYVTSFGACERDRFGLGGGVYRVVLREASAPEPEPPQAMRAPLVAEPLGPLPLRLSDTGIFDDAAHTRPISRAIRYEPAWPLWSNGSDKERWLLLPSGAKIDNERRRDWAFPPGTLFFKTFSFAGRKGGDRVETRIIRRTRNGWDYHAYLWHGDDADLLPLERSVSVPVVTDDGTDFDHEVPSRFDCRSCHESNETVVVGLNELQLSDGPQPAIGAWAARGLFARPLPSELERVSHPDAPTRAVLGYLHGNCAHCHNASARSMSHLDLTHARALQSLINVETEGSGQLAGIRVVPGAPERSVLFLAMSGESDNPELKPMPPIGVQRRDAPAIARVREWILGLDDSSANDR